MFYNFVFQKPENNRLKQKPVSQNFVIFFLLFLLKIELVGHVDQQINLVLPYENS